MTVVCAFLWMAAGCATVQTAKNFSGVSVDGASKPIATVAVENYGYYLFGAIPLVAGAPAYPNADTCRLFEDTVTLRNNMAMLAQTVKAENGKKIANVRTAEDWTGSFSLWILWRKTLSTTALITE
ncbi:MAG: hypothetical protein FWH21_07710 [Kiritimatiellaeota bacterium]|nr:hypothetical protein [Kiritimatiellota bacterium]